MILANWDNYFLLYFTFIFIATIFLDLSLTLYFMPLPCHYWWWYYNIQEKKLLHNICRGWHITLTSSNMQGMRSHDMFSLPRLTSLIASSLPILSSILLFLVIKEMVLKIAQTFFDTIFWILFNLVKSQWNVSSEKIF